MYTELDFFHARLYATEHLKKLKMDKFKSTHKHIFDHIIETSRPATNADFYVPQSLAHNCIIYTFKFTQIGCNKIACFPFKEKGAKCTDHDPTKFTRYGSSFTLSCQPACKNLYFKNPIILDTEYQNNKCLVVNHLLKYYALNPHSRGDRNYTLDIQNDKLIFNEEYCLGHGLIFDSQTNKCQTTTAQDVGEIFVGSTIYRSLNALQAPNPHPIPPPPIPQELLLPHWGSLPSFATPDIPLPEDEGTHALELVKEIAKDLSIDLSVSITAGRVAHILNKTIPAQLASGRHFVTLSTLVKSNIGMMVKSVGKVFSVASIIFEVVGLATLILDLIDPCGFGKVLTKKQLEDITMTCEREFRNEYGTNREIHPEMVIALLEADTVISEDVITFVDARVMEYLNALNVNSAGQRLKVQQANLNAIISQFHTDMNWPRIVHFGITGFFLMLAFIPSILSYVVVAYVYYIIIYSIYMNKIQKIFSPVK